MSVWLYFMTLRTTCCQNYFLSLYWVERCWLQVFTHMHKMISFFLLFLSLKLWHIASDLPPCTTGRVCGCLWQGSVHFHWCSVCVCVCTCVCILLYVLILEREVRWTLHFRSFLKIDLPLQLLHHFLFLTHYAYTHTQTPVCNLTMLNYNFLIWHCTVTIFSVCVWLGVFRCVYVWESGKWFGVIAQCVGWETAGDSSKMFMDA